MKHTEQYAKALAEKLFPDKTTLGWKDHWNLSSQRDFVTGYLAGVEKTAAIELLKAAEQFDRQFEELMNVPLGKNNEESLRIWFAFVIKDMKTAIKKATT